MCVCDSNESGTENWSLQNSLLFNEPCPTKLGLKILLTWIETLKLIMGAGVALFLTELQWPSLLQRQFIVLFCSG